MLSNDEFSGSPIGTAVGLGLHFVHGAVDEHNDVGVLFDGARFAEVGKHRALAATHLNGTGKLGKRKQRHVHFLREHLQATRDFSDLDSAVTIAAIRRRLHELQIVDDNEALLLVAQLAAGLRAHFEQREARGVVDIQFEPRKGSCSVHDGVPVAFLQITCAQLTQVHARLSAQNTLHELIGAHLQAEQGNRGAGFRGVRSEVQSK